MLKWWRNRKNHKLVDELVEKIRGGGEQSDIETFRCPWCGTLVMLGADPSDRHCVTIECHESGAHFHRVIAELPLPRPEWWEQHKKNHVWYD